MALTRTAQRLALVGLAAAAIVSLTACAPVGNAAVTNYSGWPAVSMPGEGGSGTLADGTPHAMWLGEGDKFAVITYGSGNCPNVGTTVDVIAPAGQGNAVKVNTEDQAKMPACTMDLVPHTTEFWTPQNIATTEPLKVEVNGSTITVPVKGAANLGGLEESGSH